jgi:hypothetical protein
MVNGLNVLFLLMLLINVFIFIGIVGKKRLMNIGMNIILEIGGG